MSQDAALLASPAARLRTPLLRIVMRLAELVCPPQGRTGDMMTGLVAEFESLLGSLPGSIRRPILVGLVAFDQGARLYPGARGRRFATVPDVTADAYFRAVLACRRGGLGTALARIKGLVVMCYYELPEVKDQIGYRPDAYIAAVSQRRLASYGPQIRAGEAAVLAPDPAGMDAARPPARRQDGS
jgi:hypothetical protein